MDGLLKLKKTPGTYAVAITWWRPLSEPPGDPVVIFLREDIPTEVEARAILAAAIERLGPQPGIFEQIFSFSEV